MDIAQLQHKKISIIGAARSGIAAAALLGPLPEIEVITVSVDELKPMTMDLSPPVAAALPEVSRRVRTLVG